MSKSRTVIREAVFEDCAVILDLIRELARYEKLEHEVRAELPTLQENLFGKRPKAYVLLAECDGNIAGFCLYFYDFSTFLGKPGIYIEDIFVREPYRKLGIGKRFFAELATIAKANDCGRIEWWVLDWNADAIAFYEGLGAEPMSEWTVYRLTEDKFPALAKKEAA